MTLIEKYFIVFVAGLSGIWKGIPAGIGLDILPVYTGIFTAFGSITSAMIVFFAGDTLRTRLLKLYGKERLERKKGKFSKLVQHFGPWGLGLGAAGILGPFTSVFLGLMFFANTKKFVFILSVGILIWSVLFALFFTRVYNFIAGLHLV